VSRELVLGVLALGVCGAITWLSGWVIPGAGTAPSPASPARVLECEAWRRLWAPLLPSALALTALLGWGLQEPGQTDELLRPLAPLLIAPFAVIGLRAAWRAVRALRVPSALPVAATIGLVRPRVVLDVRLAATLDAAQWTAVLAHEQAHARHRDPLRLWLAQLATDLQWPIPAARRRLDDWSSRLELARDEEARQRGIAGEDLAAAIVEAARLSAPLQAARLGAQAAVASLTGPERGLLARVQRLLAPLPEAVVGGRGWPARAGLGALLAVTLALALLAGLHFGDALVRPLPLII